MQSYRIDQKSAKLQDNTWSFDNLAISHLPLPWHQVYGILQEKGSARSSKRSQKHDHLRRISKTGRIAVQSQSDKMICISQRKVQKSQLHDESYLRSIKDIGFEADFIIIFDMANKKITKNTLDNSFYISLSINFIALIIIIVLWIKKRAPSEKSPQSINTIIQSKRQEKCEDNRRIQIIQNYRQQLKTIPIESTGAELKLIDNKVFQFHQLTQTDRSETYLEQIKLLKQQLQIQRDRNQLLEQKQIKLEALLSQIKASRDKVIPEDYQNIKNELQFCQQKLDQALQNQMQLKQKLNDYERMSISMLNHPQYQRLRSLNNKYKDTIATLQSHLLSKHEAKDGYFELSFHDL